MVFNYSELLTSYCEKITGDAAVQLGFGSEGPHISSQFWCSAKRMMYHTVHALIRMEIGTVQVNSN